MYLSWAITNRSPYIWFRNAFIVLSTDSESWSTVLAQIHPFMLPCDCRDCYPTTQRFLDQIMLIELAPLRESLDFPNM